jgi:hypothetical protein
MAAVIDDSVFEIIIFIDAVFCFTLRESLNKKDATMFILGRLGKQD